MAVDEDEEPDPELGSEGDGDDGRGATWTCGTRAVGNCRRMIAPDGRRALGLVPDHHHVVPLDFSDDGEDEYDVLCGVQAVKDKM